jgi:GT2 family glycosyltransferase
VATDASAEEQYDGELVVTLAVLSYDGRQLLEMSLPAIFEQTYRDFEVLVLDNGSSDGTADWLREQWPQVRVVALPQNVGVTAALNVCVTEARGAFVMLLNNDVELTSTCLQSLVESLVEHPEAGSAAPKLLDFKDRGVLDGAGDILTWAGFPGRRGHGERDSGQYDRPQEIFGACGGAALYRRSAFDLVGLFDADFFAFYEDTDWALRAQLAGLSCRYVPSAVAFHMGSATLGSDPSDFSRLHQWRNGPWMLLKGLPVSVLLRHGSGCGCVPGRR